MNVGTFWAGVRFQAQNGDTDGLLTDAAQRGLHLSDILPYPGGFVASCAAWHYRPLSALARRKHVHTRIQKKTGLFFRLRPLLRRTGLWAGILLFVPLLFWMQGFIWRIQYSELTAGQQARAAAVLRDTVGLMPGSHVTEAALTVGEYALLQSGEFSWASLNFLDGRLVVEAAATKPVPDIAAGTLHGIRAKVSGTIVSTNLTSGTMLVVPGQIVETGQGLIGTARAERDGTLIFQPAAGAVRAQFEWSNTQNIPLSVTVEQYTGNHSTEFILHFGGKQWKFPNIPELCLGNSEQSKTVVRHVQPEIFGLPLPIMLEETTRYFQQTEELIYSEENALALARLNSLQTLYADYPDAEKIARKEDISVVDNTLHYTVVYTIIADICT